MAGLPEFVNFLRFKAADRSRGEIPERVDSHYRDMFVSGFNLGEIADLNR